MGIGDCGPTHGPKDGFRSSATRNSCALRLQRSICASLTANVNIRCENSAQALKWHGHGCQPPEMAQIFTDCGFDAVTIANNHMYDYGPDPLLDTRALLLEKGIQVTGAGKKPGGSPPAGHRGAQWHQGRLSGLLLVIPHGGEAGPDKVGIAPLRVKTYYEPRGPHAPTRVRTEPDERDMKMILDDIASLRKQVDIVIPAFHWGVIWVPRVIADYQVTVAHACIDAGADMILGHHAHIPKAIEVYKGKAIFYSLSNFCMTKPMGPQCPWKEAPWAHGALRNYADQDPELPAATLRQRRKEDAAGQSHFLEGRRKARVLPADDDRQAVPARSAAQR